MDGAMKSPKRPCSHISSPRMLKPPSCCLVWPLRQPKAMNSLWLTKSGAGRQVESKGESSWWGGFFLGGGGGGGGGGREGGGWGRGGGGGALDGFDDEQVGVGGE